MLDCPFHPAHVWAHSDAASMVALDFVKTVQYKYNGGSDESSERGLKPKLLVALHHD